MGFKEWIDTGTPSSIGTFVLTNQDAAADSIGVKILHILLGIPNAPPPPEEGDTGTPD